jgi:hypothetical protein
MMDVTVAHYHSAECYNAECLGANKGKLPSTKVNGAYCFKNFFRFSLSFDTISWRV